MSQFERLEPVNPQNRLANERQDLLRETVVLLGELRDLLVAAVAVHPDRMIESTEKPKNGLQAWRQGGVTHGNHSKS